MEILPGRGWDLQYGILPFVTLFWLPVYEPISRASTATIPEPDNVGTPPSGLGNRDSKAVINARPFEDVTEVRSALDSSTLRLEAPDSAEALLTLPVVGVKEESQIAPSTRGQTSEDWKRSVKLLGWLTPFWLMGAIWAAVNQSTHWLALRRATNEFVPADAKLQDRLDLLAQKLQLSSRIRLMMANLLPTPFTVGVLRPSIVVPLGFATGFPPAQIDALLAHELAHVLRRDYLANVFQVLIEIAFFYHPAARRLSQEIRIQREHCCDDLAVRACGSHLALAEALACLGAQRTGKRSELLAICATGASTGETLHRVRRILDKESQSTPRTLPIHGYRVLLAAGAVPSSFRPKESDSTKFGFIGNMRKGYPPLNSHRTERGAGN